MATINLPNLSLSNIEEGLQDKDTMNNILDTLQLYRKELNFLLMNLGPDNMPSVIGRMEDTEGNISDISQTVGKISLTVASNSGDIGQLQVTADSISATVSNNAGDIGRLSIRANAIESTVADNSGQISQVMQTASSLQSTVADQAGQITVMKQTSASIQSQVTNQSGRISTLTQTANGIQTQVTNNKNSITSVTQTMSGIQSTVSYQGSQLSTARSDITQLSSSISSKVSYRDYNGREIASLINQEANRITISADALDLRGVTSIYGDNNSEATFDRYGDFNIYHGSNLVFSIYNAVTETDLYLANRRILTTSNVTRETYPIGTWDFGYADVIGLGTSDNAIEAYYRANKCYIDYGGGARLTIRDDRGRIAGYLTLE